MAMAWNKARSAARAEENEGADLSAGAATAGLTGAGTGSSIEQTARTKAGANGEVAGMSVRTGRAREGIGMPGRLALAMVFALAMVARMGLGGGAAHAQRPAPSAPARPAIQEEEAAAAQAYVPIMNYMANDEVCETWVEAQNVGADFAALSLMVFGAPGFCAPQAAGPLKIECSGLLKPGSAWNFLGSQIPSGAKSGTVYSFSTKSLSSVGLDTILGFDDIIAEYFCENVFFGIVGDADDYRRFKLAYDSGGVFAGVPLELAWGEPVAVEVLRQCASPDTPGVITAKYNATGGRRLGVYDPVYGGHASYVPLIYGEASGFETLMYVQNAGLDCTTVEIWFQQQDACIRPYICEVFTLAAGETYQYAASDCVGPGWIGSAWIRTSQPAVIAIDQIGTGLLMTYSGGPGFLRYTYEGEYTYNAGSNVAYGPLVFSEYQGWDSGVVVQNLSSVFNAKVKVYFKDRSGDIVTTLVDWVCPRGSQSFYLPAIADLPGNWVGSVRVESQAWSLPGQPVVEAQAVSGMVQLIKYPDIMRLSTTEAIAYNLLQEYDAYDWSIGSGRGGSTSGASVLAVPSLLKDLVGTGVTTELAITNFVDIPGFTDFAVIIFDQNGALDYVCQKLNEKQVEYIDMQTWGYVNPGFKGSAIISAVYWHHPVFGAEGEFLRHLVGLGGVTIERTGAPLMAEDIPGDEASGSLMFPLHDAFGFMGLEAPSCPGLEGAERVADCPAEIEIGSGDLGLAITDGATVEHTIEAKHGLAKVYRNCKVTDVDVQLAIDHGDVGDLTVELVHDVLDPATTTTRGLFSGICDGQTLISAELDDDATQAIGTVCPAVGGRYTTFGNLDAFDGEYPGDNWTLRVTDLVPGNGGRLLNWTLQLRTSPNY